MNLALFQHEDALILGMLFADFFPAYVHKVRGAGASGFGNWSGGGGGVIVKAPNYSTGRGGITRKKDGSFGVNGEAGRPGANDSISTPAEPSLCGDGGYLDGGGAGLNDGQLFFGGNASNAQAPSFGNTSAGGGSGLFGGGSSFILAGGGGGSTWVYSNNELGRKGWEAVTKLGEVEYPSWLDTPVWIGVDSSTLDYFERNKALFDVNTYHLQEYDYYDANSSVGNAFLDMIKYRNMAAGNGLILISKCNESIEINKESGLITGIDKVVCCTGQVVAWSPELPGKYEFILWGAQGGTVMYTPPYDESLPGQSFTGGFGGSCGFFLNLQPMHKEVVDNVEVDVETKLYLRVGQIGQFTRLSNAWNGGGNADNATGGGGSTDIRWKDIEGSTSWQTGSQYRLAVAGGGGGCLSSGHGGTPLGPYIQGGKDGVYEIEEEDKDVTVNLVEDEEPIYFLVNDLSLVYVTIKYYSSASLPSNSHAGCLLYINNGQEGVLYQEFKINPVSGILELVFPLDQVYPENTPTHWVTLTPEVRTNTQFIVPKGGVHIRVETRKRANEADVPLFKPLVLKALDTLKIIDTYNVQLVGRIEDIKVSVVDKLNILDTFETTLRAVTKVYESVVDKLSVFDNTRVNLESMQVEDIEMSIFETLKLVDMFHNTYTELRDSIDYNVDTASVVDSINVKLRQVEKMFVSVVETLNMSDIIEIKEEET